LSGKRSALPHGIPGNTTINNGDLILFDFGAVVNGYRSDMTRTYVLGKPDSKQKEIFNIVSSAQQAAIDAIAEGVTGDFLAQQSHKILDASPYAEFKGEGLGHGVGLELHEYPLMGKGCNLKISRGCVITIEPGIYIPEWGGIRIEDDVVLTEAGLQIINTAPKEFLEL
jgi:Xaa-Pro aminopeptidase